MACGLKQNDRLSNVLIEELEVLYSLGKRTPAHCMEKRRLRLYGQFSSTAPPPSTILHVSVPPDLQMKHFVG